MLPTHLNAACICVCIFARSHVAFVASQLLSHHTSLSLSAKRARDTE